ncbi:MAG: hydantoinase/oxoprolinase family protein [Betaproteobacteria bacterium]|nr:hydantoinase/oxoprolinase family protein [Betaproteobacteria bacterium]
MVVRSCAMTGRAEKRRYTIAVDTGGTFTDLVLADQHQILGLYKALTTPGDLLRGLTTALEAAAAAHRMSTGQLLEQTSIFIYSTTHSTNAILEGKVARTAFLTTRGHPDILLYKEGGKDQMHNWAMPFPKPYVPRRLTFEITERVTSSGTVAIALDEREVRKVVDRLAELQVEAVGVCLLWSSLNPEHELRIAAILEEHLPGVEYSLGHRVNRIIREYRRASATVIDASLKPLMRHHLNDMDSRLRALGFRGEPLMVTHVSGGVLHLDQMLERPLQTIDSGPALAPIAGIVFDRAEPATTSPDLLVIDTGGTSFDASLIVSGQVAYTREKWFGPRWTGHMTGLPAVDTKSIGAGGGSIAYVDAGGLLHVGPESAGADPGPVAYGRGGTEPTVTDAALVLGYLDSADFLGGAMPLDRDAARAAVVEHLARPLGVSAEQAAEAVLAIVSEAMRGLLGDLTVSQGKDARECVIVAGGGAAGLNVVRIAREAGIRQVLLPKLAAGLSAVGGLYSDIMAVFSRGHYALTSDFGYTGVNSVLKDLDREISEFLAGIDHPGERTRRFLCEARYEQEMWEIEVLLGKTPVFDGQSDLARLHAEFDARHLELFATQQPGAPIEVITWRGEARVIRPKPVLSDLGAAGRGTESGAAVPRSRRTAYFDGRPIDTPVYHGADLAPGARIVGPAIVSEPTTTIVLDPGCTAVVRPAHYLIEIGA